MRDIDEVLLEKIKQALRTVYNDADPKMDIIVAQTNKYLTPGLLLTPYTVRVGAILGPLDIAVRREDANAIPQGLSMVYIENGIAKVAWLNIDDHVGRGWKWQYDIGPAVDCAIDYDGRWVRIWSFNDLYFTTTSRWALVTQGEPYIALVKPDGSLTVQYGQGAPLNLAESGVTKISLMRSWKNVLLWNHDHGIIAAYIRNGEVRYRSYAQQADGVTTLWENERTLTEFAGTAANLALFRTNDYRTGLLVEINGEIHMATSTRNWAGMAIQDHTVSVTGTGLLVQMIPVAYEDAYHIHTIAVEGTEVSCKLCPPIWPQVVDIYNPGPDDTVTILIECDIDLYGTLTGLQAAFTVRDSAATPVNYAVSATAKGLTDKIIKLTVANFESAYGDLTVTYTFATAPIYSQVEGGCFMELDGFVKTFTPDLMPPEGYTKHTISVTGTSVLVDLKFVTYVYPVHNHTISVQGTGVTVTLIHVDDIPP